LSSARELNRATLARQLLLERADMPALDAVHALAGLQAQDSTGPYLSLWSRLRDFDRAELTAAVEARDVYVATLMRGTMHMVTADDHRWLKPTLPGIDRKIPNSEKILAEARRMLPARMPQLRALMAEGTNPGHFADLIQGSLPVVRVPPAGTWRVGGSAMQELVEVDEPDLDRFVLLYLRAFGPATVADAQIWAGRTGLRPVFERLDLEEIDKGLFDVPGAPRPGDVPAPPRFLPRWDNLFIAHRDREARFLLPGRTIMDAMGKNTVLVDGLVAGTWEWADGDVVVVPWRKLPRAVEAERRALCDWLA
jgi:winged helix DNA-binding protein